MVRDQWLRKQIAQACADYDAYAEEADAFIDRSRLGRHRADGANAVARAADNATENRAVAARGDAAWHQWFHAKFKQCLVDQIDQNDSFLNSIFAETFKILREEIDELRAEIKTLQSVARGEVAMIRKKDDDVAA